MRELLEQCRDLPTVSIDGGALLIEQGQAPGALYVLIDGELVVERDGVAFARIDTPGAVFGEMSAVLDVPATATVRAARPTTLHVAADAVAFVLRTTAARLDGLTRYLSDVKQQYRDLSGHLGLVDEVLNVLVHHQPKPARPGSRREPDPDY